MGLQDFTKRPENKSIKVLEKYNIENLKSVMKIKDFSFLNDEVDEDNNAKIDSIPLILEKIYKKLKKTDKFERNLVQKDEIGRYYYEKLVKENFGLLYLKNSIRGFILPNGTQDLDVVNCHPTLLLHLLNEQNLYSKELEQYVKQRKKTMEDHKFDKNLFIVMINDKHFKSNNKFLSDIHNIIYNQFIPIMKEKYKKFYDYCVKLDGSKNKQKKNPEGTFISRLLQEAEQDVMYFSMEYLKLKKIDFGCLIYDGIHIYDNGITQTQIKEMTSYIKEKCGYEVYFSVKEFPKQQLIKDTIEELDIEDYISDAEGEDLTDDKIAEIIFKEKRKYLINNNGTCYAYYKNEWVENYMDVFESWISESTINIHTDSNKKPKLVKSKTSSWENYKKQLKNIAARNLPLVDVLDKDTGILPFNNGIYNMATKTFTDYKDTDIHYFSYKVLRDYPTKSSEKFEKVREVVNEIFNGDEEATNEVFSFLCRGLGKHTTDKLALQLLGERDSGKGFLIECFSRAFNGTVGNLMSAELVTKSSLESAERQYAFLKPVCNNLICFSQEVKDKLKFDGCLWRTLVSGGDEVSYRVAYGKAAKQCIRSLCVFASNNPITFDQVGSSSTLILYSMPCKFYDENNIPTNAKEIGFAPKIKKPEYKEIFKQVEYIDAFTLFVLEFYKTEKPNYLILYEGSKELNETEEEYEDPNLLYNTIKEHYNLDFSKKSTQKIKCSEVNEDLRDINSTFIPKKINNILTGIGIERTKYNGIYYYRGLTKKVVEFAQQ